jgi:hypothetical protein
VRKLLRRDDFDFLAGLIVAAIFDHAIDEREESLVAPHADVGAGMNLGAQLAH